MPNEVGSVQAEENSLRTQRNTVQIKHQAELREMQKKNEDEVEGVITHSQEQIAALRAGYDVVLSKEAEKLEERLADVRTRNEERVKAEKTSGEDEAKKTHAFYQDRIIGYRKNGEAQLDSERKDLQARSGALHERAKKAERAEKNHRPERRREFKC